MENPILSRSRSRSRMKAKRCVESFVPDCMFMDMFSRLHLKIVARCRCVCKRWRDLLSTPEFMVLHKQRCGIGGKNVLQLILVDEPKKNNRVDHFFIDNYLIDQPKILPPRRKNPIKKSIIRRIHSYPLYRTEFSMEGFLVMTSVCEHSVKSVCDHSHSILIVNPIEPECNGVKILCPDRLFGLINVYGIYFNPRVKEHCVLLTLQSRARSCSWCNEYWLLTLGAKPRWTYLRYPWNYKAKFETSVLERTRQVMVGECLYWLVVPMNDEPSSNNEDLMEFNTRTEEFTLIKTPSETSDDYEVCLLNIDGFVSLAHISMDIIINIWTLKDRVAQSWTRSMYRVLLDLDDLPSTWSHWESYEPIGVECGQINFQHETTLYACKLKGEELSICGKKKHNKGTRFFSHSFSLASLKKCQPVICMEGVDDKTHNENCKDCGTLAKKEAHGSNGAGLDQQ